MGGISGFAGFAAPPRLLERMTRSMLHRGPDEEGFFLRERVGLGACRRIAGDRARGRQPTWNQDGTVVAVLDGTIYNHRELHHDLAARGLRIEDRSGAAAIVHLYEARGMELLGALRGMFALALYDTRSGELFLARDRLGLKPLYFWQSGGKLLFGSEIKAVLESDEVPREPQLESIDAYLRLGYVPGPATMFAGIRKLPPGCSLTFRAGRTRIERYWTPPLPAGPPAGDEACRERFGAIFAETMRLHLESDAPVGAYLSGDLGSSLIAAAAAAERGPGVPTFAVGLGAVGASGAVSKLVTHLGSRHHQVSCGPEDAALLPRIVWHLDEPLADPLALPLFLLSRAAREETSVVVTAAGASEVLAGYRVHRIMRLAGSVRSPFSASLLRRFATPLVRRLPAAPGGRGRRRLGAFLEIAATGDAEAIHELLVSRFDHDDRHRLYLAGSALAATLYGGGTETKPPAKLASFLDQVLALQYRTWLPDNILASQDRMASAHGVEARSPFLDHLLVEFLLGVPPHLKLGSVLGPNQVLARDHARTRLPRAVVANRDSGFHAAADGVLATPAFRDLVADTLAVELVRRRGYFDPAEVARLVAEAGSRGGQGGHSQVLALVMLELWHRLFIDRTHHDAPQ